LQESQCLSSRRLHSPPVMPPRSSKWIPVALLLLGLAVRMKGRRMLKSGPRDSTESRGRLLLSLPRRRAFRAGIRCSLKRKAAPFSLFKKRGKVTMPGRVFLRRPTENAANGEKVEPLTAGLLGPIKNKPIQRADGTILAPTSVESHRAWACWIERSNDD